MRLKELIQRLLAKRNRKNLVIGIAGSLLLLLFLFSLPGKLFNDPVSAVLEDRNGELLNATIASDGQWRFPYNEAVPEKFATCLTVFEDKRFFEHAGVDMSAMSRALRSNLSGKRTQGGSTITMQTIRLALKNEERTVWNKFQESVLAVRLELTHSKKEILALYASNAPFGSNVVGLDAAAWRWFGRDATKLSWAENAMLAVLPNSPALIHPGRNRNALLQKRNALLDRLFEIGKLSADEAELAKQEPLPDKPRALPQFAPHLLQLFRKDHKGENIIAASTLDGSLQRNLNSILLRRHEALSSIGINNLCAIVLDVETGNCLAYAGNVLGSKSVPDPDVDVIQSPRSPGSALKPLLYAAMLNDGMMLPESLIPDVPLQINGYTPQNFNLGYDGAVPASRALARSLNIPAVKMLQQFKHARFYETLKNCGINTLTNHADFYGLSMVLGGCEVKMWELAGAYASMARVLNHQSKNKGVNDPDDWHAPIYLKRQTVKTKRQTESAHRSSLIAHNTFDATSVWFTFKAMQELMRPGEEGLWQQFASAKQIAWKTGTSFGFRDGWSVGVTPKHVVAVWAGNTSGEGKAGLIGIETAAPVMFDIFRLLPTESNFRKPQYNYTRVPVCRISGFRAGPNCEPVDTLRMPPNALKSPQCNYHRIIQLDANGIYSVNESCVSPSDMRPAKWFVLPPSMEFYYRQSHADYKPIPPLLPGCTPVTKTKQLEIIYPHHNAKLFLPKELNGGRGMLVFIAAHRDPLAKLFWTLDNTFAGTTEREHKLALAPAKGKHVITITDKQGNSTGVAFEIIDEN